MNVRLLVTALLLSAIIPLTGCADAIAERVGNNDKVTQPDVCDKPAYDSSEICALAPPAETNKDTPLICSPESPWSKTELILTLPEVMSKKDYNKGLKAELKNNGTKGVHLVLPGDGSNCGWRTPTIGWSFLQVDSKEKHPKKAKPFGMARCGNINPLKANEVFILESNKSKALRQWIGFPGYLLKPGKYRAVLYYTNIPDIKWSGLPLGKHDEEAMKKIKASDPVALMSNEVIVEITE